MSISDFDHLDIPRRISGMIMERIGTNSKGQQPKKSMQTMEMDI